MIGDLDGLWMFLKVLGALLGTWGLAVLVQKEVQDRRFWRDIRERGCAVNPRDNTRKQG